MKDVAHRRRKQHGIAMVYALSLILTITVIVTATQIQMTSQLRASTSEKNYERALQMAEAGINAYINRLARGTATGTNSQLIPPLYQLPNDFPLTIQNFRQRARQSLLPNECFIYYPPGQTQQGYFVGHLASSTSSQYDVVAYGWCNGVARRVKVRVDSDGIFDWGAVYGLNPIIDCGNHEYAVKFGGTASAVGPWGSEGQIIYSTANNNFYDGPLRQVGPNVVFGNGTPPSFSSSSSGVPSGHPSTSDHVHSMANPTIETVANSLGFRTADEVANLRIPGNTEGVEYFRSHNDNATGLRYLVQNTATGTVRELTGSYRVMVGDNYTGSDPCDDDWVLDTELKPGNLALTNLGMQAGETYYGVRVYPGDYFFEGISMTTSHHLSLRTYNDAERSTVSRSLAVDGDPANPNSGQSDNKIVRFWIGHSHTTFGDINTTLDTNTVLEYPNYASRWRIYSTSLGTLALRGRDVSPAPTFTSYILAYGRDCDGNGYGSVQTNNSVYHLGTIIGWTLLIRGGSVVERQQGENGPDDFAAEAINGTRTYQAKSWTELL